MKRARLRTKFLNIKSDIDRKAYNKQRNICVSLIRNEKKNFFSNINMRNITDNKTIWKKVRSFFTDKIKTKHQAVAVLFNKFVINIAPNLKRSTDHRYDNDFIATDEQVTNAVNKFRNHSSIVMIKPRKKMIKVFLLVP